MRRPRISLLALAALAALAWTPSVALAGPDSPTSAVVAMGDSFISGEGGRWLGNGVVALGERDGTDRAAYGCRWWGCRHDASRVYGPSAETGCDRSDVAPITTSGIPVDLRVNLACSGARAENVWRSSAGGRPHRGEPPQADQLAAVAARHDVRMVVLTVGANDVGFGRLVLGCVLAWTTTPAHDPLHCRFGAQARLESAMPAARAGVRTAVREIRAVMRRAGYTRRDYRLVIAGYASPLPRGADIRYPEASWARLHTGGCPTWDADANWARFVATPYIVEAMARIAAVEGAQFLDLQRILDGHEVCHEAASLASGSNPPLAAESEWVRRLSPGCCGGTLRESLHPNAYGQRAIGRCLGLAYAARRGDWTCRRRGDAIRSAFLAPAR